MTVDEIISQIAYLSLNEDDPDADMQARILAYLNNAYREAYRSSAPLNRTDLLSSESVTITSGVGALAAEPFKIMQVVDTNNDVVLKESDILEIEQSDRALDDTGDATHYYMTSGTAINLYPKTASTTLTVRTIANPTDLATGGAETTIKIPVAFHDLLVEGGLFYMYQDERDVRTVQEITAARTMFDVKLNDMKRHLMNKPRKRLRTKAQYF